MPNCKCVINEASSQPPDLLLLKMFVDMQRNVMCLAGG